MPKYRKVRTGHQRCNVQTCTPVIHRIAYFIETFSIISADP